MDKRIDRNQTTGDENAECLADGLRIGIYGPGRAGSAFALALASRGAHITAACGPHPESASAARLSARLGVVPGSLAAMLASSTVVLVTVPDAAIPAAARRLAEALASPEFGKISGGKLFLHVSGASTSELLLPLAEAGAEIGSLHPIQSFTDTADSWRKMLGISFGFEGSLAARKASESIVSLLQGDLLLLNAETKPLYHAAACMISNYTAALACTAGSLLEAAGIDSKTGIKAFAPLLSGTVDNILNMGSLQALTGPVSRGDLVTVRGHLEAFKTLGEAAGDTEALYKSAGIVAAKMALKKGTIDEVKFAELSLLLSRP